MTWLKNNAKWLLPIISFIGGLLLGFYLEVLKYESKLQVIENSIMRVEDDIKDIESLIQNRILTKSVDNNQSIP